MKKKTTSMKPVPSLSPIDKLEKKKEDLRNQIGEYFIKNIKLSELYMWAFESIDVLCKHPEYNNECKEAIRFFTSLSFCFTDRIDTPLTKEMAGDGIVYWFEMYDYQDVKAAIAVASNCYFQDFRQLNYDADSVDIHMNTLKHMMRIIDFFKQWYDTYCKILDLKSAA